MPSVGIPWLDYCCGCLVTESTNVIIKKKLQRLFLCFQSYPNFCQYCELKLLVGVAFGFWWQSENVIYWIWDVVTHIHSILYCLHVDLFLFFNYEADIHCLDIVTVYISSMLFVLYVCFNLKSFEWRLFRLFYMKDFEQTLLVGIVMFGLNIIETHSIGCAIHAWIHWIFW